MALATVASAQVAAVARAAIADHERFILALSVGTTPRATYERLATHYAAVVDWERVHVLFVDERCVPAADSAGNYGMVEEVLLSRVPIPAERVHRIPGELGAKVAASSYADLVAGLLDGHGIDLAILGVGADGHTASLFPGSAALDSQGLVVAVEEPAGSPPVARVSLGFPALAQARGVLFLVSGAAKAAAVATIRAGGSDLPAATVAAAKVTFLLDEAAASG